MANTILKTENITKKYGGTQVLSNVSITLENGRIYGLIGVNGAGKTTLMRQILGLSIPTSGEIELFGKRGNAEEPEIETCFNALYGTMMLRLQKKDISPDTQHAIKEITTFIGMLSDYYKKDKEEGLKFED